MSHELLSEKGARACIAVKSPEPAIQALGLGHPGNWCHSDLNLLSRRVCVACPFLVLPLFRVLQY